MENPDMPTRREVLKAGIGVSMGAMPMEGSGIAIPSRSARPKLAVILTQYGAQSHGVCYCTKFLEGKQFDDHYEEPRCDVVAIHLKEISTDDVGVATAAKHHVPMYPSVATALCQGGDTLAVDGVVVVGEHGTYPLNAK